MTKSAIQSVPAHFARHIQGRASKVFISSFGTTTPIPNKFFAKQTKKCEKIYPLLDPLYEKFFQTESSFPLIPFFSFVNSVPLGVQTQYIPFNQAVSLSQQMNGILVNGFKSTPFFFSHVDCHRLVSRLRHMQGLQRK